MKLKKVFSVFLLVVVSVGVSGWGFFAHKKINRLAVFTLPVEMVGFYKRNIAYLSEKAVNPDMRRYVVKEEACRHYIDLDKYGDSAANRLPRYFKEAVASLTLDTMQLYGMVPWHIDRVQYRLTQAFLTQDAEAVLRLSADLGHYIGDANVPLHTTSNYNGQKTGQDGIHGFWESRLPELFFEDYDFFVGKAEYVHNTQLRSWEAVKEAHAALDSVLLMEKLLTEKFPDSKKYSFEARGASTVRVYSFDFSRKYHDMLNGMVERQMRKAVKMTGDFWYTAWVDGGQPRINDWGVRLDTLIESNMMKAEILHRSHESGEIIE
ncbi:zinc dependent phospholipase C family protein [Marinoscillum sp. MHG1-6]|uniref:zinc dependent phospholipase C family protein n=1 Tax=Marinoscillum sp. MHG1-6 TaxID=2959627 RepID=UPI002157FC35|nr:zinc dependent phospholipase C family protein [Marinoscillum sp. MHG1-6]